RLSWEKGVDILIDAVARLPKDLAWNLTIVGDGLEKGNIEKKIAGCGIAEKINFRGWLQGEALTRSYADADILIVPSRVPESFGIIVVESMHQGTPVIVPSIG